MKTQISNRMSMIGQDLQIHLENYNPYESFPANIHTKGIVISESCKKSYVYIKEKEIIEKMYGNEIRNIYPFIAYNEGIEKMFYVFYEDLERTSMRIIDKELFHKWHNDGSLKTVEFYASYSGIVAHKEKIRELDELRSVEGKFAEIFKGQVATKTSKGITYKGKFDPSWNCIVEDVEEYDIKQCERCGKYHSYYGTENYSLDEDYCFYCNMEMLASKEAFYCSLCDKIHYDEPSERFIDTDVEETKFKDGRDESILFSDNYHYSYDKIKINKAISEIGLSYSGLICERCFGNELKEYYHGELFELYKKYNEQGFKKFFNDDHLIGFEFEYNHNASFDNYLLNPEMLEDMQTLIIDLCKKYDSQDYISLQFDASLDDYGIEVVCCPIGIKAFFSKIEFFKELFAVLELYGFHDASDRASCQIHFDKTSWELSSKGAIERLWDSVHENEQELRILSQREDSKWLDEYSAFAGKDKFEEIWSLQEQGAEKKCYCLNMHHGETVEFRMFQSTLDIELLLHYIDYCVALIDSAKYKI